MMSMSTVCMVALDSLDLFTEPSKAAWQCEELAISINS